MNAFLNCENQGSYDIEQLDLAEELHKEIQENITVDGWKKVKINENGEPLVPIGFCSGNKYRNLYSASAYGYDIDINLDAYNGSVENGLTTCFMREGIATKILEAEKLLPKNCHFMILDPWRSKEVQAALYKQYSEKLKEQHPKWKAKKIAKETQKFVSLPSTDPKKPSTHNTGGAIDLAIIRFSDELEQKIEEIDQLINEFDKVNNGEEIYKLELERHNLIAQNAEILNFGTAFDDASDTASVDYYEKQAKERELNPDEIEIRDNRRLLCNAMRLIGGTPFPSEWWHFNFGNQMANITSNGKIQAIYGAVTLSTENIEHENTLRHHREGSLIISKALETKKSGRLNIIAKRKMGITAIDGTAKSPGKYSDIGPGLHQIIAIQPEESAVA